MEKVEVKVSISPMKESKYSYVLVHWWKYNIYLNAKVSQLLLKCYFLLFDPNILLRDIVINKSMICRPKKMKIRPVNFTIANLQQEI